MAIGRAVDRVRDEELAGLARLRHAGEELVVRDARIAAELGREACVRLEEEVTPEALRRVAAHELAAAVVMETPAAARRHGVRIDALQGRAAARRAAGGAPLRRRRRDPGRRVRRRARAAPARAGRAARSTRGCGRVLRAAGFELDRTMQTLSAPWDRRMLPVASGEAVCGVRRRLGRAGDRRASSRCRSIRR